MSEPEITNPEKTKNPKRVEQGKRLAAISREAKERKRQQQEEFFESAKDEGNKIFFGIGLIGAAVLIYEMVYKKFFNSKTEGPEGPEADSEDEVTEAYTEPEDRRLAQPPKAPKQPPEEPRKTRSYEPYTMD